MGTEIFYKSKIERFLEKDARIGPLLIKRETRGVLKGKHELIVVLVEARFPGLGQVAQESLQWVYLEKAFDNIAKLVLTLNEDDLRDFIETVGMVFTEQKYE